MHAKHILLEIASIFDGTTEKRRACIFYALQAIGKHLLYNFCFCLLSSGYYFRCFRWLLLFHSQCAGRFIYYVHDYVYGYFFCAFFFAKMYALYISVNMNHWHSNACWFKRKWPKPILRDKLNFASRLLLQNLWFFFLIYLPRCRKSRKKQNKRNGNDREHHVSMKFCIWSKNTQNNQQNAFFFTAFWSYQCNLHSKNEIQ